MSLLTIRTQCPRCPAEKELTVDAEAYEKWRKGALLQNCFPNLSADDRERLLTGICPTCWDSIFEDVE